MNALVTGGSSLLAKAVARHFRGQGWGARLVDAIPCSTEGEWEQTDFLSPDANAELLRQCSVLIHLFGFHGSGGGTEDANGAYLDQLTAGTYSLLQSAKDNAVEHVVAVSSFDVFSGYPECYRISESWAPLPVLEIGPLAQYLAEEVCRHSARTLQLDTVLLRIGEVVIEEDVVEGAQNPLWIDARDVAASIWDACTKPIRGHEAGHAYGSNPWRVYHLVVPQENERFATGKSLHYSLQFVPEHRFGWASPEEEAKTSCK